MTGYSQNCYQSARKAANISQETAAELLDISTRSLADYETFMRVPPNATVVRMAEAYDAPWLALAHLKNTSGPLGVLPEEIRIQSLPTAVLALIDKATALSDEYRQMIHITADGRIDRSEQAEFEAIKEAIRGVIAAGFQVLYTDDQGTKKDRLDAGTSKRPVQGLASENDSKIIIAQRLGECKGDFYRMGGDLL